MSRNIGSTECQFCQGEVRMVEPPRPITREEAGPYFDVNPCPCPSRPYLPQAYSYEGMIVANAECVDCCAKYLAWIDQRACVGYGELTEHDRRVSAESGTFFDMSFRSSFDDEPGKADMPVYRIEVHRVRVGPWNGPTA